MIAEEVITEAVATVADEVTDEFCSNEEFDDGSKAKESEKETVVYKLECWDPGNKWKIQDVYNHMGETLEQMFHVFKVSSEDQQYQLDLLEKVKETFQLRLEMKNFKDIEKVIDNFRRQGHVQGGGCVKFFRKFL